MTWEHGETISQLPLCLLYPSTELNQQNVIAEFGPKPHKNNRKIIISLKNVISTIHCYISKCSGTLSGRLATSLHLIQVFYKLSDFFHVMAVKLAHDLRPCHMIINTKDWGYQGTKVQRKCVLFISSYLVQRFFGVMAPYFYFEVVLSLRSRKQLFSRSWNTPSFLT